MAPSPLLAPMARNGRSVVRVSKSIFQHSCLHGLIIEPLVGRQLVTQPLIMERFNALRPQTPLTDTTNSSCTKPWRVLMVPISDAHLPAATVEAGTTQRQRRSLFVKAASSEPALTATPPPTIRDNSVRTVHKARVGDKRTMMRQQHWWSEYQNPVRMKSVVPE
jgi:hypothetical protein